MKSVYTFALRLCVFLIHYVCLSAETSTSGTVLNSWTNNLSHQVSQSDLIFLGRITSSQAANADSSWTTITSRINVTTTLKGTAPKALKFQSVRMEPRHWWELDSLWAVECGVSIKGDEDRTAFQAMQNLPALNIGRNAVVFLRKVNDQWCLVAAYLADDAARFKDVVKAEKAKRRTTNGQNAPISFNITLPEHAFLTTGSVPVRCTIVNRGHQTIILDPLGFPSQKSSGLLPILTSGKSKLLEISDEGRNELFPVRSKSNRDGVAIPPSGNVSVWIDLRDYASIPVGEWNVALALDIKYDTRKVYFGIDPTTIQRVSIRSNSIPFSVGR